MKTRISKYQKYISAIFLASYILFIGITIIHYHHIDIQNGNFRFIDNDEFQVNLFDKLVDITHECTIQQFANTILDFNFKADLNLIKDNSKFDFINSEVIELPNYSIHNSNPLRAPPSFYQFI